MKWLDVTLIGVFVCLFSFMSVSQTLFSEVKGVETTIVPDISLATDKGILPPNLTAKAITVYDLDLQNFLYQKSADEKFYPASTTKIVTALVSLLTYQTDQVLTVKNGYQAIGSTIKLHKDEEITFNNLLSGLLIASGNDAALTLAENHPDGYAGFVTAMNRYVEKLGLTNTHFTNPSGIINPNHYTTAADLNFLAKEAFSNASIRRIIATKNLTINDVNHKYEHLLETTNKLLDLDGVRGMKTGWTPESGECLVTVVERNGHSLLIVLLNSADRFGESKSLIDWAYQNFSW